MIVAPFTYSKTQTTNGIYIHRIRLLCQGGQTPWSEDSQPIDDILQPNGIYTKGTHTIELPTGQSCVLAEVDTQKTDMTSMYTWHEIEPSDSEMLCWRTFTFGTSGTHIWLPQPNTECFATIHEIYKIYAHI